MGQPCAWLRSSAVLDAQREDITGGNFDCTALAWEFASEATTYGFLRLVHRVLGGNATWLGRRDNRGLEGKASRGCQPPHRNTDEKCDELWVPTASC